MPKVRKITPPDHDEPAGPPPGFPMLTRADVRDWVGETMLRRGESYVHRALFDLRRSGRTIKASCQGSAVQPYHVQVTIGAHSIESDDCTCPVGANCKHVAALLLAWIEDPDAFVEVEDVGAALERRDKPELIALIRQMLARYPDLETMLELPLPVAGKSRQPADPALISRQVSAAFWGRGDDWHAAADVANRLDGLIQIGNGYASLGDWASAITVYQTIATSILEHYNELGDEDGDLAMVVNTCVSGLGTCLENSTDQDQRNEILGTLFDIYRWDVEYGGIDMGYEAPSIIRSQVTPEERRLVAGWVQAALPASDSWSSNWRRQAFGGFLLKLAGEQLDDEEFLRISRETGRRRDLIGRLLTLGRIDEAEREAREAEDSELLDMADLLREHGQLERAMRLVRMRMTGSNWKDRYSVWLLDRARERGDHTEALTLASELFWHQPGLQRYKEIQAQAEAAGSWSKLRPELLDRLARAGQYALLTEIHLHEGQVARALETIGHATEERFYSGEALSIRVAQAAEQDHPLEAIGLYTAAAEHLIRAQGRENYVIAAGYLTRVRNLYRRLGENAVWAALITDLRTRNRRLRALKEELDRAGL